MTGFSISYNDDLRDKNAIDRATLKLKIVYAKSLVYIIIQTDE